MKLSDLLTQFRALATPGAYANSHVHHGKLHDQHVVFGTMIHGNEYGSLPAAVRLLEELRDGRIQFGGRLTLFVGNPEAAQANVRFLDRDLNRLFGVPADPDTHEGRRAQELAPIVDSADWFIDFHQTILASATPFYIGPWSTEAYGLCRAIAATDVWIVFDRTTGIGCADEYFAARRRPGVTLELGEKGFNKESAQVCYDAMVRTLALVDAIAADQTTLDEAACAQDELVFWHTVHRERCTSRAMRLRPGLINFQPVTSGEQLSDAGAPVLTAPIDGALLFPKYFDPNKELPKEIFRVIQPLAIHPTERYGA